MQGPWKKNPNAPIGIWHGLVLDGAFAGLHPGTTKYKDGSGLGIDGTLTGYADPAAGWGWASEIGRQRVSFDASDDWIDCGTSEAAACPGSWSIAAWVRCTSFADYRMIIARTLGSDRRNFEIDIEQATGKLRTYFTQGQGVYIGFIANTALVLNAWHHVAAVYNGATLQIFRDGSLDGSVNQTGACDTAGHTLAIGRLGGSSANYFAGDIADPLVWNRSLSGPEWTWLANPANLLYVPDTSLAVYVSGGAPPAGAKPWLWIPDSQMVGGMSA